LAASRRRRLACLASSGSTGKTPGLRVTLQPVGASGPAAEGGLRTFAPFREECDPEPMSPV
jgi:hypothetical protein